jgi:putative membrane protein
VPPELQAFAAGFPLVLLHAAAAIGLLALGCAAHVLLGRVRELPLIRDGNAAAAISFGGVMIGLALGQAASLFAAHALIEVAIWGASILLVQLLAFRLIDMLFAGLPERIGEGDVAAAGLLVAGKLALAMILAAAILG